MYSLEQAWKNICRNPRLSLASLATTSACIFLLCLFLALAANLRGLVKEIETQVGITVFFNEDLSREEIEELGRQIGERPEVKEMQFTSAEKAWEDFRQVYFQGKEELAEGFAEDNPLKGSANYSIFLRDLDRQPEFLAYLQTLPGVRQVNYSAGAVQALLTANRIVTIVSLILIGILLLVSLFLIGNAVSVSAEFRKRETGIMRLIGATNTMIRAPFVIQGVLLGFLGALLPLILVYLLYRYGVQYAQMNLALPEMLRFVPIEKIFPQMIGLSLILSMGMGFLASYPAIRKHLKV